MPALLPTYQEAAMTDLETPNFNAWMRKTRDTKWHAADKADRTYWTMTACAARIDMGQSQWSKLENADIQRKSGETSRPTREIVLRVAQALEVDPDEALKAAGYLPGTGVALVDQETLTLQRIADILEEMNNRMAVLTRIDERVERIEQGLATK